MLYKNALLLYFYYIINLQIKRAFIGPNWFTPPFGWEGGHPDYPEPIEEFFRYIHHSSWCYKNYDLQEVKNSYDRVADLSLDELRSISTSFTRREHYCSGAWETILERDDFGPVLSRLHELLE